MRFCKLKKMSLVLGLGLSVAAPALANIIPFTGNTDLAATMFGASVSGTNNFAVLTSGGDPADVAALAATGVAGAGSPLAVPLGPGLFYYVFQATVDAVPGNHLISRITYSTGVAVPASSLLWWGSFDTVAVDPIMTDTLVPVSPLGGPDATPADGPGLDMDDPGATYTGLVPIGPLVSPSSVTLGSGSMVVDYTGLLPLGSTSVLVGYVSTLPPAWFAASMFDGGVSATGESPAPIPAPAAVILGALGLGLVGRIRRHFA